MSDPHLTHLDAAGRARMVDVGDKPVTERRAVAQAVVRVSPETANTVMEGDAPKGDVLGVARIAGIQAAKRTSELIPLCHPLPLSFVGVACACKVDCELGVDLACHSLVVKGRGRARRLVEELGSKVRKPAGLGHSGDLDEKPWVPEQNIVGKNRQVRPELRDVETRRVLPPTGG